MKKIFSKVVIFYLTILTRFYIKLHQIKIIGITGSVGKTTLVALTYEILKKRYLVDMSIKNQHGLNSETGVPFAIFDIHIDSYSIKSWFIYLIMVFFKFLFSKPKYKEFVLEIGVDKPNDMDILQRMIGNIDIAVFLSIAKVHAQNFEQDAKKYAIDSFTHYFNEKAKLIKNLRESSIAVLNFNEKQILKLKDFTNAKVISFGTEKGADVFGEIIEEKEKYTKIGITYKNEYFEAEISNFVLSKKILSTICCACAIGFIKGISSQEIKETIENFKLPPGRMSILNGIKDTILIDSSYNSSTDAVIEALDVLKRFKSRKKIAVLGDMRELGVYSESEHKKIAKKAVEVANVIVTIGPMMKKYFVPEAINLNFDEKLIFPFENTWKALYFIKEKLIKGGEIILIKGSQNTLLLEIIVEGLLQDQTQKDIVLTRRGEHWEKKRQQLREV